MTTPILSTPYRALISAHRCGRADRAELDNRVAGVHEAARIGAHFVEFDIQRCVDGVYVCHHDDEVLGPAGEPLAISRLTSTELLSLRPDLDTLEALLGAVADTGLSAHLDLKFTSPDHAYADPDTTWEVDCARRCVEVLGAERMILTTTEDRSVKVLRHWVRAQGHSTLVGLSLGRHPRGMKIRHQLRIRFSELFPGRRMAECDATLVVAHHVLAQLRLLRWASRRDLPVLVFTVDGHRKARRFLHDHRVWLMTTNWPARALALPTP